MEKLPSKKMMLDTGVTRRQETQRKTHKSTRVDSGVHW